MIERKINGCYKIYMKKNGIIYCVDVNENEDGDDIIYHLTLVPPESSSGWILSPSDNEKHYSLQSIKLKNMNLDSYLTINSNDNIVFRIEPTDYIFDYGSWFDISDCIRGAGENDYLSFDNDFILHYVDKNRSQNIYLKRIYS